MSAPVAGDAPASGLEAAPARALVRERGVVRWFSQEKGFGFIALHGSAKDIFVHENSVQGGVSYGLDRGSHVEFDVIEGQNSRRKAVRVVVLEGTPEESGEWPPRDLMQAGGRCVPAGVRGRVSPEAAAPPPGSSPSVPSLPAGSAGGHAPVPTPLPGTSGLYRPHPDVLGPGAEEVPCAPFSPRDDPVTHTEQRAQVGALPWFGGRPVVVAAHPDAAGAPTLPGDGPNASSHDPGGPLPCPTGLEAGLGDAVGQVGEAGVSSPPSAPAPLVPIPSAPSTPQSHEVTIAPPREATVKAARALPGNTSGGPSGGQTAVLDGALGEGQVAQTPVLVPALAPPLSVVIRPVRTSPPIRSSPSSASIDSGSASASTGGAAGSFGEPPWGEQMYGGVGDPATLLCDASTDLADRLHVSVDPRARRLRQPPRPGTQALRRSGSSYPCPRPWWEGSNPSVLAGFGPTVDRSDYLFAFPDGSLGAGSQHSFYMLAAGNYGAFLAGSHDGYGTAPTSPYDGYSVTPAGPHGGYGVAPAIPHGGHGAVPASPHEGNDAASASLHGGYVAAPTGPRGGHEAVPASPHGGHDAVPASPHGGHDAVPTSPHGGYDAVPTSPHGGYDAAPASSHGGYGTAPANPHRVAGYYVALATSGQLPYGYVDLSPSQLPYGYGGQLVYHLPQTVAGACALPPGVVPWQGSPVGETADAGRLGTPLFFPGSHAPTKSQVSSERGTRGGRARCPTEELPGRGRAPARSDPAAPPDTAPAAEPQVISRCADYRAHPSKPCDPRMVGAPPRLAGSQQVAVPLRLTEAQPDNRPATVTNVPGSTGAVVAQLMGASSGEQLVVHNLPWNFTNEDLRHAFSVAGLVTRAEVVLDSTGRSRGFGIVRFSSTAEADAAIRDLHGLQLGGRTISARRDRFG